MLARGFLRDLVQYIPSQLAPALVGFFSIPVITRIFPPADYGVYTVVMATVAVLGTIAGWLGMAVVRFDASYEGSPPAAGRFRTNTVLLALLTIALIAGAATAAVLGAGHLAAPEVTDLMLLGLLVFAVRAFNDSVASFLVARRLGCWYSLYRSWDTVATFGLGLAFVWWLRAGLAGLLWGAVATGACALPGLWSKCLGRLEWRLDKTLLMRQAREMAAYAMPLVVGNLASWVLSLSDRYVIAFYRPAYEVGVYAASYNIAEKTISMLATLFHTGAVPLAIQVWERKGDEEVKRLLRSITRIYLITAIPAVVGLSVLARPVVGLLLGAGYLEGYRVLPLVGAGAFFIGFQQRYQPGLLLTKKTSFIMTSMGVAAVVNVALNLLLVPPYGYMAAAATTLACYAILALAVAVLSRRYLVWPFPLGSLARALVAAGLMGLIVYPIGQGFTASAAANLLIGILVGGVVYTVALLALGELSREEKAAIWAILWRRHSMQDSRP